MSVRRLLGSILASQIAVAAFGASPESLDPAAAFGARPSLSMLSLSPDGASVAYVAPAEGQGSVLYTMRLGVHPRAIPALVADGKPWRISQCDWVANTRLACEIYAVQIASRFNYELVSLSRLIAVDQDGKNQRVLSTQPGLYARGVELGGGEIIDRLPDEDGVVLMSRNYVSSDRAGSATGSREQGLGVDRIDTRTGQSQTVEIPQEGVVSYISDGHGHIRIMGTQVAGTALHQVRSYYKFFYRTATSRDWQPLSTHDFLDHTGFSPLAVDPDLNAVFGLKKKDGRYALYKIALDGSLHEELVFERPDVDVGANGIVVIGRRQRPIGVTYVTDKVNVYYFDTDLQKMHASLARALPQTPDISISDSSTDESKLLLIAENDHDPGIYYRFDRQAHQMQPLLAVRDQLDGVPLASVKAIDYPAQDGTRIPAYLTLPPGKDSAKGLPAIVMPHGGPEARDTGGFDWLAQFFAHQGYVVLQPNFRGSTGYGDAWFEHNGYQSWKIAIGDVLDAGRWLVTEGVADPARLAVVGWSYGGYAALQSAVVDPKVFKAVIAIAPVTDLDALRDEWRGWSNHEVEEQRIGDGPQVREGSPRRNVSRLEVPVLLFHGTFDRNVSYRQSKDMAAACSAVHARCELVTFDGLDHQLDDSTARTQLLRKSDDFLRQSLAASH
jgi:dipeptidyl aminopeptidase/acylaminoacyl peptidase